MAIDRTFLNGWVDDSGTGLDGTVWNKARINEMLNSIDAALVATATVRTRFTPSITDASFATVPYNTSLCDWFRVGPLIVVSIGCYSINITTPTVALNLSMPVQPLTTDEANFPIRILGGAISEFGLAAAQNTGWLKVSRLAGTTLGAAVTHIYGQGFYWSA